MSECTSFTVGPVTYTLQESGRWVISTDGIGADPFNYLCHAYSRALADLKAIKAGIDFLNHDQSPRLVTAAEMAMMAGISTAAVYYYARNRSKWSGEVPMPEQKGNGAMAFDELEAKVWASYIKDRRGKVSRRWRTTP